MYQTVCRRNIFFIYRGRSKYIRKIYPFSLAQMYINPSTYSPPNDAATTTEPATDPAALAAAANPLAPITGMIVPNVGARAPRPAAIAGAANPVNQNP